MRLIILLASTLFVQQALAQNPKATSSLPDIAKHGEKMEMVKWDDYTSVFRDINSALPGLRSMLQEKKEAFELLREIRASNEILENEWQGESDKAWTAIWKATDAAVVVQNAKARWESQTSTPKEFLQGLKANLSILENIADKKKLEDASVVALLKDVSQDMKIKAAYCQRHGWASLIAVTVVTKKDGSLQEGYEVSYVPKGWAKDANQWLAFPKLSTAIKNLPPGVYMMRVKGLEPVPIEIDGNGTKKQDVELKVP